MEIFDRLPDRRAETQCLGASVRLVDVWPGDAKGAVEMFRVDRKTGDTAPFYENRNLIVNSSRSIVAHLLAGGDWAADYRVNTAKYGDILWEEEGYVKSPTTAQLPQVTDTDLVHAHEELTITDTTLDDGGNPRFSVVAVDQTPTGAWFCRYRLSVSWDLPGYRVVTEQGLFSRNGTMFSRIVHPSFVLNAQFGLITLWTIVL